MSKKMSKNISFIKLESYTTPEIVESSSREWVTWGDNNDYFQYLIDRFNGSSVNNAIITGVSEMIFGEGLEATNPEVNPDGFAQMKKLFSDHNGQNPLKNCALDLKMQGQFALNIIFSVDRTRIAKVKHIPIETLRAEKCDTGGEIRGYYYSADWNNTNKFTPKRIQAFDVDNRDEASQILYVKPYRAGSFYYSPVDYQGCLNYCMLDEEVSVYHLANVQNGLAPSILFSFNNGVPPIKERQQIEQNIQKKWGGAGNTGRFVLAFNESKDTSPEITSVPLSDADKQYQFLSEEITRKIKAGHRVSNGSLFGLKGDGGASFSNNAEELKNASQYFDNTVVRPYQNLILSAVNKILAVNEINLDTYFVTLQPLEFTEIEEVQDEAVVEKETGIKKDQKTMNPKETEEPIDEIVPEPIDEVVDEPIEEEIVQKEASYNGAQISSAIDIIAKVGEGILTKEQATVFLIQFLQLPPEVAKGFFSGEKNPVEALTKLQNQKNNIKQEQFDSDWLNKELTIEDK